MPIPIKLSTVGKYLDQPALMEKINNVTPFVLATAGASYCVYDTFNAEKNDQKKKLIQNASVMTFTIASALLATRGLKIKGKEIFKGLIEFPQVHKYDFEQVLSKAYGERIIKIIDKIKDGKILNLKQVRELEFHLNDTLNDPSLLKKIIPDAHNHGAFEELKDLSLIGLIPVIGGIAGGIVGDLLTKTNPKDNFSDKIKEGSYQYLNNIFLCNVGAGLSMVLMNKLNVKSKAVRFSAMLAGVAGVGLAAGSLIANFVGKNLINPIFNKQKSVHSDFCSKFKDLNSERRPEALDVSLHLDDVASVGFMSGFKWIGPILPVLYSVSGYRAGIGYRNGKTAEKRKSAV
jgi:hypothetical protein